MLFNEPKLLKSVRTARRCLPFCRFSALQRAEIAEIGWEGQPQIAETISFSALQRAEIAEICSSAPNAPRWASGFSALQRAEIAEIITDAPQALEDTCFSALQRAEIAEINTGRGVQNIGHRVSVLFNEPKLLKSHRREL